MSVYFFIHYITSHTRKHPVICPQVWNEWVPKKVQKWWDCNVFHCLLFWIIYFPSLCYPSPYPKMTGNKVKKWKVVGQYRLDGTQTLYLCVCVTLHNTKAHSLLQWFWTCAKSNEWLFYTMLNERKMYASDVFGTKQYFYNYWACVTVHTMQMLSILWVWKAHVDIKPFLTQKV